MNYITKGEFSEFCSQQGQLVNLLNHNITILRNDVKWLKRLQFWIFGVLSAILISSIGGLIT